MSSREVITKAARQNSWTTAVDERSQMVFHRVGLKVVTIFRRDGGLQIAEFWNGPDIDLISGGCPAVVDTLRMFGRAR